MSLLQKCAKVNPSRTRRLRRRDLLHPYKIKGLAETETSLRQDIEEAKATLVALRKKRRGKRGDELRAIQTQIRVVANRLEELNDKLKDENVEKDIADLFESMEITTGAPLKL